MKKLFALILISLMLLSSCADLGNSGSGDYTFPYDVLIVTNKPPFPDEKYTVTEDHPRANVDHILPFRSMDGELAKDYLSCEVDGKFLSSNDPSDVFGIFDSEKNFKTVFESFTTAGYSDYFPKNFFDTYVIAYAYLSACEGAFAKMDYSFDSESKELEIQYSNRELEGWIPMAEEILGYTTFFIPIAKSDITVDGKLVPYEELSINFTRGGNGMVTPE